MTSNVYDPQTPQPFDIPADSQDDFLSNFSLLNQFFGVDHIPFGNSVEAATLANPCKITSTNHRLTTGNTVTIANMEGLNNGVIVPWTINGNSYTVTVIDANNFTLTGVNSSAFPTYIPNTGCFSCASLPYGYHTKNTFINPLTAGPVKKSPQSAYYTKLVTEIDPVTQKEIKVVRLFYQNSNLVEQQLTGYTFTQTKNGIGISTPWGITINMGQILGTNNVSGTPYDFPIPFNTALYCIMATPFTNKDTESVCQTISVQSVAPFTQFRVLCYQSFGSPIPNPPVLKTYYLAIGS